MNSIYDQRNDHARSVRLARVRLARRGWPKPSERPKCLECGARLKPDWKYVRRENDPHSTETDERTAWLGYGNVFCSRRCAQRYALCTPAAQAAAARNTDRIAELHADRTHEVVGDTKPYVVEVDYPHMGHQCYEFWTRRLAFDLFDVERRDLSVILTFPREVAR